MNKYLLSLVALGFVAGCSPGAPTAPRLLTSDPSPALRGSASSTATGAASVVPAGVTWPDVFGGQVSATPSRAPASTVGETVEFQWLNPAFVPGTTIQPDTKAHAGCTGGDLVLESGLTPEHPQGWDVPVLGFLPTAQEGAVLFDVRQTTFSDGVVRGSFQITNGGRVRDTKTGEWFTLRATGAGYYQGYSSPYVLDMEGSVSVWLYGDAGSLIKQIHHFHYMVSQSGKVEFINDYPVDFECLRSAF